MMRFEHRAVPIVLSAVLIDTIGFGIIMPVFPQLITQLGNVGIEQATRIAGYMLVVFALTQFIAGPILGNLSDRFGRRPVLLASMLAFGIDYALMAMAPDLWWLFVGRAVAGAAGAVYGPAGSVLADVTPPEKRSAAFGFIGAAFGLGFIIGPALGGLLADFGPRAPFFAASALALINAAVMAVALPETLARENRRPFRLRDAHIVGAFRPLFSAGNAMPLLAAGFLWQLAHMVYPATWSFWATIRFNWDAEAIGWSLAFVGLVSVIFQAGLVGRVIAKTGERRAIILGLSCGATAFLLYASIAQPWQVYMLIMFGAVSGLVQPALSGTLSGMVGPSEQGALQGGVASLTSIAAIIGPLMLTQALALGVDRDFPGAAFLLAGLLTLVALSIILWALPKRLKGNDHPVAEA